MRAAGERDEGLPALGNRLFDRAREAFGCRPSQRRPIGNDDHLSARTEVEVEPSSPTPLPVDGRGGSSLWSGDVLAAPAPTCRLAVRRLAVFVTAVSSL